MYGVERDVEEEGFALLLGGDDALRFGGDEVRDVAVLTNGLLIAMPVVHGEARRSVVDDGLRVVVDAPGVVTVLVHEALRHR